MDRLHSNLLAYVASNLSYQDLLNFALTCKTFKASIEKNLNIVVEEYLRNLSIPNLPTLGFNRFMQILDRLERQSSITHFQAYYTSGGVYQGMKYYSINNLSAVIGNNTRYGPGAYCTTSQCDIMIKGGISSYDLDSQQIDYGTNLNLQDNVYVDEDLKAQLAQNQVQEPCIALIKRIVCSSPRGGYTCPITTLLVFGCMEENEFNDNFVNQFKGIRDSQQMVEVAQQFEYQTSVEEDNDCFYVTFQPKRQPINPLCFVDFKMDTGSRVAQIRLQSPVVMKHYYALLLDCKVRTRDTNIDTGPINFYGALVSLKELLGQ